MTSQDGAAGGGSDAAQGAPLEGIDGAPPWAKRIVLDSHERMGIATALFAVQAQLVPWLRAHMVGPEAKALTHCRIDRMLTSLEQFLVDASCVLGVAAGALMRSEPEAAGEVRHFDRHPCTQAALVGALWTKALPLVTCAACLTGVEVELRERFAKSAQPPTHYAPDNSDLVACGLIDPSYAADELPKVTCRKCLRAELGKVRAERDDARAELGNVRRICEANFAGWQAEERAAKKERDEARAELGKVRTAAAAAKDAQIVAMRERNDARRELGEVREALLAFGARCDRLNEYCGDATRRASDAVKERDEAREALEKRALECAENCGALNGAIVRAHAERDDARAELGAARENERALRELLAVSDRAVNAYRQIRGEGEEPWDAPRWRCFAIGCDQPVFALIENPLAPGETIGQCRTHCGSLFERDLAHLGELRAERDEARAQRDEAAKFHADAETALAVVRKELGMALRRIHELEGERGRP